MRENIQVMGRNFNTRDTYRGMVGGGTAILTHEEYTDRSRVAAYNTRKRFIFLTTTYSLRDYNGEIYNFTTDTYYNGDGEVVEILVHAENTGQSEARIRMGERELDSVLNHHLG